MSDKSRSATIAEAVEADFEEETWTFRMLGNFDIDTGSLQGISVGAGRYVLIREPYFKEIMRSTECRPVFDSIKTLFPEAKGWPDVLEVIENQRNRLESYANGTASDCARAAIRGANTLSEKLEKLLKAAKTYATNNLQDERDDPELCHNAEHRAEIIALFDAISEAETP